MTQLPMLKGWGELIELVLRRNLVALVAAAEDGRGDEAVKVVTDRIFAALASRDPEAARSDEDAEFIRAWLKRNANIGPEACHRLNLIANRLSADPEAAKLEEMREALIDWRNSWLCPETAFEQQIPRLLRTTDAALGAANTPEQQTR